MRKQDGPEYQPDSLHVLQAAIDRHLRDSDCTFSIIRFREFFESKKVLEGKAQQRQQGKGKRPNKARALNENEEETALGSGNARHKQSSSPVTDGLVVTNPIFLGSEAGRNTTA